MGTVQIVLTAVGASVGVMGLWLKWMERARRKQLLAEKVTWELCFVVANEMRKELRRWDPDLVVGIGRSGGIWGGWFAGNLGTLPFGVVDVYYDEDGNPSFPAGRNVLRALQAEHPAARKILVIEGASATGKTPNWFRRDFADEFRSWGWKVRIGVLFLSATSNAELQYVGRMGPEHWPDRLPWHQEPVWRTFLRRKAS